MLEARWQQPEIRAYFSYDQEISPKRFWDVIYNDAATIDYSNPKKLYFKDNPFTQTELLSTQDDQVQRLIYQIKNSIAISNHESLANELLALFNIAKEENPASPGIALDSLNTFYDFLQFHTNIKIPTLSLSPDYNIYASWRAKENVFSAHFLPNSEIRFVLFKPNHRHPKHKIRITGIATSDTLMEITPSENLNDWVFDER
jgi:hypothetical protein